MAQSPKGYNEFMPAMVGNSNVEMGRHGDTRGMRLDPDEAWVKGLLGLTGLGFEWGAKEGYVNKALSLADRAISSVLPYGKDPWDLRGDDTDPDTNKPYRYWGESEPIYKERIKNEREAYERRKRNNRSSIGGETPVVAQAPLANRNQQQVVAQSRQVPPPQQMAPQQMAQMMAKSMVANQQAVNNKIANADTPRMAELKKIYATGTAKDKAIVKGIIDKERKEQVMQAMAASPFYNV